MNFDITPESNGFNLEQTSGAARGASSSGQTTRAIEASLTRDVEGTTLTVSGFPVHWLESLAMMGFLPEDAAETTNILFGERSFTSSIDRDGTVRRLTPSASLTMVARAVIEGSFQTFDDDAIAINDTQLAQLANVREAPITAWARLSGPVEASDVEWIARGFTDSYDPLEVEIRTSMAVQVLKSGAFMIRTRDEEAALAVAAAAIRDQLAQTIDVALAEIDLPDAGLVRTLFESRDAIVMDSADVRASPASIDVGFRVPTSVSGAADSSDPDQSLVYDVPTNSWHGD